MAHPHTSRREEHRAPLDEEDAEDNVPLLHNESPAGSMEEIGGKPLAVEHEGFRRAGIAAEEQPVAPDQFIPGYETGRWELWSYYIYYMGNTGLSSFYFAPTAFQNLLYQAAGEKGTLEFAGR